MKAAALITALRRLVDFDPRSLSPQTHALKAILERLEPHKLQPIRDAAGTRLSLPRRGCSCVAFAWSMSASWPAGSAPPRRLPRSDVGTSQIAGQWRKLTDSAELMVGPDCGARCAIRDNGAPRARPLPLDRHSVRRD
jgi:hypothetical protein